MTPVYRPKEPVLKEPEPDKPRESWEQMAKRLGLKVVDGKVG